jgi:transcriptional regulator with XRE-family HTH domain
MDKRDLSSIFRDRLKLLLQRSGLKQSAFAAQVGVDRSALSQLLSGGTTRLPRAETLLNIAAAQQVSLDWLLGLSQDEGVTGELRAALELEEGADAHHGALLARWHTEAAGTKIRYVPAGIPDLLRSEALIDYEAAMTRRSRSVQIDDTQSKIDYNRRPETDMEVCMPRHTLDIFRRGLGIWSDFPARERQAQLEHMARLMDDLYPSFRLFLYDGRERYSIPYTIFGSSRAAIYAGDMYLVLNATEPVRMLTRHFDTLIRSAVVHAHEAAAHAQALAEAPLDQT